MLKDKSKVTWPIIIFSVALIIRLIYFFQIKANFPGWDTPTIDPLYHDLWAKQIASGDILGSGPFFRAPFYAYFLGIIYAVFGPSIMAAKIIQIILGAMSCSLIFIFADRLFNRRIALISGFISTFNWVFVYYENELLLDPLLIPMTLGLLWGLLLAAEKPMKRIFIFTGLLLGLACITRPNYLIVLPGILLWMIIVWKGEFRNIIFRFGLILISCFIVILPVTLRNSLIGQDRVLIASQGGINFYIGNNQYADGISAIVPEFGNTWQYSDCEFLVQKETDRLGQHVKASEVSSYFNQRAYDFIRDKPYKWLSLTVKKFIVFWNGYEISNNQNLYFFRQFASATKILPPLFYIISPLSILGMFLIGKYGRKYSIMTIFVFAYMISVVAFFVNGRFRLPVWPALIVLAGVSIDSIFELALSRNFRKLAIILIAILVLAAVVNMDYYDISDENFALSHFSLGNVFLRKGMNDKALEEYHKALSLSECVPSAHLNRGIIFLNQNDPAKAREEFELELSACKVSAQAHNNLAVIDRLEGKDLYSLQHATRAVQIFPQYVEGYVNMIQALRKLNRHEEASMIADSLVMMFPDYSLGHYYKGKYLSENGKLNEAEEQFRIIIDRKPEGLIEKYDLSSIYTEQTPMGFKQERVLGLAYYEMGLLKVKENRIDEAEEYFYNTAEILPNFADGWINLALAYDQHQKYRQALDCYKQAIDLEPNNHLAYYNCALTLGKLGMLNEAMEFLNIALEIKSDFALAREKLNQIEKIVKSSPQK